MPLSDLGRTQCDAERTPGDGTLRHRLAEPDYLPSTRHTEPARGPRTLEPERPDLALFPEEVPGEGVRIVRSYQHARWLGGATVVWIARSKGPGPTQAGSGLRFDLVD